MGRVVIQMELRDIIAAIKHDFPGRAEDLSESLELLNETISRTMNEVNDHINEAFLNRDFETREAYNKIAMAIYKYEQLLEGVADELDIEEPENGHTTEMEVDEEAYFTDPNVEHTLYEDFTHKRPAGFRIGGSGPLEVKTWMEMLRKTIEQLIKQDEEKFREVMRMDKMKGRKRKYLSSNSAGLADPLQVHEGLFVESNLSSNSIRNLIIKLLREYNVDINEVKVYFRADFA